MMVTLNDDKSDGAYVAGPVTQSKDYRVGAAFNNMILPVKVLDYNVRGQKIYSKVGLIVVKQTGCLVC